MVSSVYSNYSKHTKKLQLRHRVCADSCRLIFAYVARVWYTKQSFGLVAHENSTFRNLALAVSGPFMALMGAFTYFKCACDSTLVYVCQADAEICLFASTILSQTPQHTPQVTYDAGRNSA